MDMNGSDDSDSSFGEEEGISFDSVDRFAKRRPGFSSGIFEHPHNLSACSSIDEDSFIGGTDNSFQESILVPVPVL